MKFSSFPSFPPPRALLGYLPDRAFYHLHLFHQDMSIPDITRSTALVYTGTVEKRMSLDAVLALVIGGAGASIPEVAILKRIFKMPIMAGFLASIFGMGGPLVLKELDKGPRLSYERGHSKESTARGTWLSKRQKRLKHGLKI